ncbi:tRNA (adenosine(37)-N6)-dimethylallyltransferase MiaA [Naasia aerilata]|uniref:tRNA dimethylallyltransferase n=1 Tax=Naasia aerilata TaxID=1162966 RepID=A0ABN6XUL1_9MICO|nr:tRNA (adenosine(37)-N6)-dimethylallyltransferase MiaA [Naasia aerilata]BDZ47582.1 tRNA dimethylallyltransferase [Naasia aerilata]
MTEPPELVAIVGPTGTGKSALSLMVAEALTAQGRAAEIVNADAMQLYRGMDIGTAKLPPAERRGIPHHLLDILEVTEPSTVADYQRDARAAIAEIQGRGGVPILVGGSGLYLSAVLHDFRFPGTDPELRSRLEGDLEESGAPAMWHRLRERDPDAAAAIDQGNGRRVVRALEVIELTGRPYAASLPDESRLWQPARVVLLDVPPGRRPALKERLARRARQMFDEGLLDEVRTLLDAGLERGTTARRAIGYAQAVDVLRGRADLPEAVDDTVQLTLRYARRQRSWFARWGEAVRLDAEDPELSRVALDVVGDGAGRGISP